MSAPNAQTANGNSQGRLYAWEGSEVEPRAVGTIYKTVCTTFVDTSLARDMVQVTMHHKDTQGTLGALNAAQGFAAEMTTYLRAPVQGHVSVYLEDFNPSQPHNPLARVDFGTPGTYIVSHQPREIALCLSYYAGQNSKRYRGRFYVPYSWIYYAATSAPAAMGNRPTATDQGIVMNFRTVPQHNSLNGWEWGVASTVDKTHRRVTNIWCDDEWDIQRRRGFRGTSRLEQTIP